MSDRRRTVRRSLPRCFIADLMYCSTALPLVCFQRPMALGPLVAARAALPERPPWSLLFAQAYARVAERRPELRRAYYPRPWPRIVEYPYSIASVAVEREYEGEPAVFFALFPRLESTPLAEATAKLRRYQTGPVAESGTSRRILRITRYPLPVRRLLWELALNWLPGWRQKFVGTFGLSVTAGLGATAVQLVSPMPTVLHYDAFGPGGAITVRLTFDHRVLDGAPVARALADLEGELLGRTLEELKAMPAGAAGFIGKSA